MPMIQRTTSSCPASSAYAGRLGLQQAIHACQTLDSNMQGFCQENGLISEQMFYYLTIIEQLIMRARSSEGSGVSFFPLNTL